MDSASRSQPRYVVALVAGLALLLALLAPRAATAQEYADPAPVEFAGMAMHPFWDGVSPRDWERELRTVRANGGNVVRVDIAWSSLELEGKGMWSRGYQRRIDAFLARARAHRVRVIAALLETPCWASSAPSRLRQGCRGEWWDRGVTRYPPRQAGLYARAARHIAERWGDELLALEIWNEPNADVFLRGGDPALHYARMVRASYRPVKRAAPGLTVLAGSMALADTDFLADLYERGRIRGRYDAIAYHPYTDGTDPDAGADSRGVKWSFRQGAPALYDVMRSHGDRSPELWATEAGASTCTSEHIRCVSEDDQASFVRAYLRGASQFPYLKAMVIYQLRDRGGDPGDPESHFGLLSRSFQPKPSLRAFRVARRG